MIRRLIDYLPPVIRDVREFRAIMNDGEQAEIAELWDAVEAAFNDQFISEATENGIERWEKILGISPKGTDTLDARRFRILSRLNEQLPYTLPVLEDILRSLCGENGYSLEVQNELYTLKVKVALVAKSNVDDVDVLLRRFAPANMVIELSLKYNKWQKLKELAWGGLKTLTWKDIKEEVLA